MEWSKLNTYAIAAYQAGDPDSGAQLSGLARKATENALALARIDTDGALGELRCAVRGAANDEVDEDALASFPKAAGDFIEAISAIGNQLISDDSVEARREMANVSLVQAIGAAAIFHANPIAAHKSAEQGYVERAFATADADLVDRFARAQMHIKRALWDRSIEQRPRLSAVPCALGNAAVDMCLKARLLPKGEIGLREWAIPAASVLRRIPKLRNSESAARSVLFDM